MSKNNYKLANTNDDLVNNDQDNTTNEDLKVENPVVTATVVADKLNIRKEPDKTANNVVTIVNKDDKLVLNNYKHNANWYEVTTASGVTGFCMSKFVKID